jgi:hypothetical protein
LAAGLERFHADPKQNRSSIFAFVAFSDGKPDSTLPENALKACGTSGFRSGSLIAIERRPGFNAGAVLAWNAFGRRGHAG